MALLVYAFIWLLVTSSLCRIGNTETVFSALNDVIRLIVVTGNEPFLLVSVISEVLYCGACHIWELCTVQFTE